MASKRGGQRSVPSDFILGARSSTKAEFISGILLLLLHYLTNHYLTIAPHSSVTLIRQHVVTSTAFKLGTTALI